MIEGRGDPATSGAGPAVFLNGLQLEETQKQLVLAVDINDRGATGAANTQNGFSEFIIGGVENNDITSPTTVSFGDIDVTLSHSSSGLIGDRRRTDPTDAGLFTQQELLRDFAFARGATANDGFDVLVEGLVPGLPYEITLWSFDDGSSPSRTSDWFANGVLVMDDYTFNGSVDPTTNDDYSFTFLTFADSSGNLLIEGRYVSGSNPGVFLNALAIVALPEPGTGMVVLLASLGLAAVRRRRRG